GLVATGPVRASDDGRGRGGRSDEGPAASGAMGAPVGRGVSAAAGPGAAAEVGWLRFPGSGRTADADGTVRVRSPTVGTRAVTTVKTPTKTASHP
ncbi:MAG: hypothetical protein ACRDY7_11775, partial [Acidimicrobiia bacterium]